MKICRMCGCTEPQSREDAKALGLSDEFENGLYNCCQLVTWADEQWLAWAEAAEADGKSVEDVTRPLEIEEGRMNSFRPDKGALTRLDGAEQGSGVLQRLGRMLARCVSGRAPTDHFCRHPVDS